MRGKQLIEGNEPQESSEVLTACPECQTGMMRLQLLTYFTWLAQELVTVPNFPAWVCDVCGRREYDLRAIQWLNTLLKPDAGRTAPRLRSTPPRRGSARRGARPQP